jgi:hypothetical protein
MVRASPGTWRRRGECQRRGQVGTIADMQATPRVALAVDSGSGEIGVLFYPLFFRAL